MDYFIFNFMKNKFLFLLSAALFFAACGDDSSSASAADNNSSSSISDALDPSKIFEIRKPSMTAVPYEDYTGKEATEEIIQHDWVCTFDYDGAQGFFYMQSTPVSAIQIMSVMPSFETDLAELVLNGKKVEVKDVVYEWGGNHHNDQINFVFDNKKFSYNHSSFGFGWRICSEMDCLQVRDSNGNDIVDGCTKDRSLPIVCRQVDEDGKLGDFKDVFERCPGDVD